MGRDDLPIMEPYPPSTMSREDLASFEKRDRRRRREAARKYPWYFGTKGVKGEILPFWEGRD